MAAIGWYGPLIDLSDAASHIGSYVQLLVFVHRSSPIQYKLSKGGALVRTDIRVGDDTRPFFSISLWQKQIGSNATVGDVILLQNVRITKFGGVVEARTVHCSSLQRLVHPYESLITKGTDDLLDDCRVGVPTKQKLRKVIEWVQQAGSTLCNPEQHGYQKGLLQKNWKVNEEIKPQDFLSLLQVSNLKQSCKASFYASVGEIFLPITWRDVTETEKEKMFFSRRIRDMAHSSMVEDLICTGCQLCGSPLELDHESLYKQNNVPLYCHSSPNRLHKTSLIYRPFMLYVWDEVDYIPLLVKNMAAKLLFGGIKAESIHKPLRGRRHYSADNIPSANQPPARTSADAETAGEKDTECSSGNVKKSPCCENPDNTYEIWLILLKLLLQQGKNSPLRFEINVNTSLDKENGRFEMVSVKFPCFRNK